MQITYFRSFAEMCNPRLAALIAKELRRLHEMDVPGSKDAQLWSDLSKLLDKGRLCNVGRLYWFISIDDTFCAALGLSFDDKTKQKLYASISIEKLKEEIEALKVCFYIAEFGLYMVLCSMARGYLPFKFWSSMMQR